MASRRKPGPWKQHRGLSQPHSAGLAFGGACCATVCGSGTLTFPGTFPFLVSCAQRGLTQLATDTF